MKTKKEQEERTPGRNEKSMEERRNTILFFLQGEYNDVRKKLFGWEGTNEFRVAVAPLSAAENLMPKRSEEGFRATVSLIKVSMVSVD